jgi:hypothetical protein
LSSWLEGPSEAFFLLVFLIASFFCFFFGWEVEELVEIEGPAVDEGLLTVYFFAG